MSHRPILYKRTKRLRKLMRRTPPAYFDIVQWLKDRRYAQTTGEANAIILNKRVRSGSHTLGIDNALRQAADGSIENYEVVRRLIPVAHRDQVICLEAF